MRIRQIKPEFWKHEGLATVKRDARLLFIGLLHLADGWGFLEDRPKRIRAELFPYDDDVTHAALDEWLASLIAIGVVVRQRSEGHDLLLIPTFRKHQLNGMHKEEKSRPPRWKVASDLFHPGDEGGGQGGDQGGEEGGDQGGEDTETDLRQGGDGSTTLATRVGARVATRSSPSRGNGVLGKRGAGVTGNGQTAPPGDQGGGTDGERDPRLSAVAAGGGFLVAPNTGEVLDSAWLVSIEQLTAEQVGVVFAEGKRLTGHEIRYPHGFGKALEALRAERRAAKAIEDQQAVQREADERKAAKQAVDDIEVNRCRAMLDAIEAWFLGDGAATLAAIMSVPVHASSLDSARRSGGTNLSLYILGKTYPDLAKVAADHSGMPK